jgi:hypothetical protein
VHILRCTLLSSADRRGCVQEVVILCGPLRRPNNFLGVVYRSSWGWKSASGIGEIVFRRLNIVLEDQQRLRVIIPDQYQLSTSMYYIFPIFISIITNPRFPSYFASSSRNTVLAAGIESPPHFAGRVYSVRYLMFPPTTSELFIPS